MGGGLGPWRDRWGTKVAAFYSRMWAEALADGEIVGVLLLTIPTSTV